MLDNLFKNIGKKIKTLAEIAFVIIVLLGAIGMLINIANADSRNFASAGLLSILQFVFLVIGAWVGMFCLYGFGELIDKVMDIDKKLGGEMVNAPTSSTPNVLPVMTKEPTPSQPLVAVCEQCRNQVAAKQLTKVKDAQGNDHYICKDCLNTKQ